MTTERSLRARMMPVAAAISLLVMAVSIFLARNWPLVHDAPLLHYVVFLMDHGWAPYRDIVEMNMPGSYMIEWTVIHTLGGGAAGWLLWDILTGVVAVLAAAWIAGAGRRAAGVCAGALAYALHLSAGPMDLGQRDWVVAVLLLLTWGFTFKAIRQAKPAWLAGAIFCLSIGASIKPPVAVLALCVLAGYIWQARSRRASSGDVRAAALGPALGPALGWALLGAVVPLAATGIFLWRWQVVPSFLEDLRTLVPWYASLQKLSFGHLLVKSQPLFLWPVSLGTLFLFVRNRSWKSWESDLLLVGALAGVALFLIQGKGFPYHRYSALAFLLLWAMIEIDRGLRTVSWSYAGSVGLLLLTVVILGPMFLLREMHVQYSTDVESHLEGDLRDLGGSELTGHVQCLDMTMGSCINVLYRMKLVQATGFIYDFYLFPQEENVTARDLQTRFLREIDANPPRVIVLSSHTWPGDTFSYAQVARWPVFQQRLADKYQLLHEYREDAKLGPAGYRIYALRKEGRP